MPPGLGSAFFSCPVQNAAGDTYLDNGWTLYETGSAELRSVFETASAAGTSVASDS